jgi:predicted DNA-binding transcriptional regulator AlpA
MCHAGELGVSTRIAMAGREVGLRPCPSRTEIAQRTQLKWPTTSACAALCYIARFGIALFTLEKAAPVAKSENGPKTVVFSLATVVLSCENVVAANKPSSRTRKMKHSKTISPAEKPTSFAPSLYRIGDVMALLQVSHATIYRMVAKGELDLVKLSSRTSRITSASVTRLLSSRTGQGSHDTA